MSNSTIDLVLVGAGHIASAWADAIQASPKVRLRGVADPCLPAARRLADRFDAVSVSDHRRLFAEYRADAVLICTPPASHAEIALDAFDHGLSVLCEKPLCTDLQTAQRVVGRAQQTGCTLTLASKFRYVDDVARARDLLWDGAIGALRLVENCFTSRVDMSGRWYSDPAISGGGVLIDNGTHSVDLFRFFLGPLTEVLAVAEPGLQSLPVEDTARLQARNAEGISGHADLSWSLDRRRATYLELHGTEGSLEIGWRASRHRVADGPWKVIGEGYDKAGAFRRMLDDFCSGLGGAPTRTTWHDALASVAVIEAAYQSLRQGAWEPVATRQPAVRHLRALAR